MATREEKIEEIKRLRGEAEPKMTREEKIAEIRRLQAGPSLGTQAEAAIEGFGKEASFGALPFLQAGAEKYITDPLVQLTTGQEQPDVPFQERVQSFAQRGENLEQEAPGAYLGGQVGGFVAPALATGGITSGAIEGANALRASRGIGAGVRAMRAARAAGLPASEVSAQALRAASGVAKADRLAGLGKAVGVLGAEGAAFGAAQTPESAVQTGDFFAPGERLGQAAEGFVFGGSLPIVGTAAKSMWNLTKEAPKAMLSAFTNTRLSDLKKYVENPELVRRAEDLGKEGVMKLVDDVVSPLRLAVEKGEADLEFAEKSFKEMKSVIVEQFKNNKRLAEMEFKRAKGDLDHAINLRKQELKMIPPPIDLVDSVTDGVRTLKDRAVRSSKDATDLLVADIAKKGGKVRLEALTDVIDDHIDRLTLSGTGEAPTKETQDIIDKLRSFRDGNVASWQGEQDARDVKKMLLDLDRSRVNLMNVGAFDSIQQAVYKDLRGVIDNQLKDQSDVYREAMLGVQSNFELLSRASQAFGDPKRAISKLHSIDSPKLGEERAILDELSKITGADYSTPIKEYMMARDEARMLSSKALQLNIIKDFPEFDDYKQARDAYGKLKNLTALEERRIADAEAFKTMQFQKVVEAGQRLENAKMAFEDVKTFTGLNTEAKINQLSRALNSVDQQGIMIREEFKKLSQLAETDFLELVDSLNVAKRFRTEKIQGSRNVNLFTALSYAPSVAIGGILGGPVGIAFGAAAGALVDKFGGRMAQKTLDAVIGIKGLPTVQKIRNLNLPDPVKRVLEKDLEQFLVPGGVRLNMEPDEDKINVGAGMVPRIRQEVASRNDLNSIERAEMLSNLNESSTLVNAQKFIFGKKDTQEEVRKLRRG